MAYTASLEAGSSTPRPLGTLRGWVRYSQAVSAHKMARNSGVPRVQMRPSALPCFSMYPENGKDIGWPNSADATLCVAVLL